MPLLRKDAVPLDASGDPIDETIMYQAITSFSVAHPTGGYPVAVTEGTLMRGSHELVQGVVSSFFTPAGSSTDELNAIKNNRFHRDDG